MIYVSTENYNAFFEKHYKGEVAKHLRLGQAFHQFMDLNKITGHAKPWCDKLYEADGQKAHEMIRGMISD